MTRLNDAQKRPQSLHLWIVRIYRSQAASAATALLRPLNWFGTRPSPSLPSVTRWDTTAFTRKPTMTDPTDSALLTTSTVADRLGVTRKQIRAWVQRGLLAPRVRTRHGHYRWAGADVAAVARAVSEARAAYLARHAGLAAATARSA